MQLICYMKLRREKRCNNRCWATSNVGSQYYLLKTPDKWVTSGGLGTMGFGFPAAIGAQIAKPDELVIAIVGDAGFQMTLQELSVLKNTLYLLKYLF